MVSDAIPRIEPLGIGGIRGDGAIFLRRTTRILGGTGSPRESQGHCWGGATGAVCTR